MNESQTCYLTLHPIILNGGSAIELELITQTVILWSYQHSLRAICHVALTLAKLNEKLY